MISNSWTSIVPEALSESVAKIWSFPIADSGYIGLLFDFEPLILSQSIEILLV